MPEDSPGGENLDPQKLRMDFGVLETGGFEEKPGDVDDAKDFVDVLRGGELDDEEVKLNEIEGKEEEISKDDFLTLVQDARITNADAAADNSTADKRNKARQELRDEGINDGYITCRDIRGSNRTAIDRRSERNDEIDSLMEAVGTGKVTAEQKAKLLSEDIGLTQERLDEWGVEEGVVVVELNEKQKREKLISKNEDLYRDLFFADFDEDNYDKRNDEIFDLFNVSRDAVQEIVNKRGVAMVGTDHRDAFYVMQDVYFDHIFGQEVFRGIENDKRDLDVTIRSTKNADGNIRSLAEATLRIQRPALEQKIKGKTRGVGNDRGWLTMNSALAGDYMLRHFELKELDNGSDYGTVVKILKRDYLQVGQIGGSKDVAIANEPKAELIKQMIQVHDLCVEVDTSSFRSTENIRPALILKIDESLIAMLSIKKGNMSVVPRVVATYDAVMRERYEIDGNQINIEDKVIEEKVKARLIRDFDNEDELNLFMRMGKDVCKLTAIDAQYGYPYDVQLGDKRGLAPADRGAFFRGIFNFNKALVTYNKTKDPNITQLNSGIKLGAIAFWNKQRDDEMIYGVKAKDIPDSAPLTEDKIVEVVNTKLAGKANFEGWLGTMKGYTDAKKEESNFMTNSPTLSTFVEKVVPAYMGYLQFTPDKGRTYLLGRLTNCMVYFLSQPDGESKTRASIQSLFLKDNNFDGKGLFNTVDEMNKWYNKVAGVNLDTREYTRKEFGDRVYSNRVAKIEKSWLYRNTVGRLNGD